MGEVRGEIVRASVRDKLYFFLCFVFVVIIMILILRDKVFLGLSFLERKLFYFY